jgi:predicted  nucleic acid-binding Zn-ribbon protein
MKKWRSIVLCLVLVASMVVAAACEGIAIPPEYQAMIDEYETLKTDVSRLQGDLDDANIQVVDLTAQLAAAEAGAADLPAANTKIVTLTAELASANDTITRLNGDLAAASSQISQLQAQLAAAGSGNGNSGSTTPNNSAELTTLRNQVSGLSSSVYSLERQVSSLNSQLLLARNLIEESEEDTADILDDLADATLDASVYKFVLMLAASNTETFVIEDHRDNSPISVQFSDADDEGVGISINDISWLEAVLPDINAAISNAFDEAFDLDDIVTEVEAEIASFDEWEFVFELAEAAVSLKLTETIDIDTTINVQPVDRDLEFNLDLNGHDIDTRINIRNVTFSNAANKTKDTAAAVYSLDVSITDSTNLAGRGTSGIIGSATADGNGAAENGIVVWGTTDGGETERVRLVLSNIDVRGEYIAISDDGMGWSKKTEVVATNCDFWKTTTLTNYGLGVYLPAPNSFTFENCTFTGAIGGYIKGGTHVFTNCTFIGTGDLAAPTYRGGGCYSTGDALAIDDCVGYNYPISVTINNGTFNSTNADGIHVFSTAANDASRANSVSLTITGAPTFTVDDGRHDKHFEAYSAAERSAAETASIYTKITDN